MIGRLDQLGVQYLATSLRPYFYKHADRFPLQNYVRIVYNDALTFDPKTKQGGLKANFLIPKVSRAP